jgi:hypothetical protein
MFLSQEIADFEVAYYADVTMYQGTAGNLVAKHNRGALYRANCGYEMKLVTEP